MSIATSLTALQTAKTDIATAITTKGGTVTSGDGFSDFATDIGTIPSGITPTGSISITANGTYDVTTKASAVVSINPEGKIIVTTDTGSTVTCAKDSVTLTATEESGTWTFYPTSTGTWIITATKGTNTKTVSVIVTDIAIRTTISYATTIADMALGTNVQLLENGTYTDYLVVEKRSNAVAVLRKTTPSKKELGGLKTTDINYINGTIDTYLTGTYISRFTADVQNLFIAQAIKCINYANNIWSIEEVSRSIFTPSVYEMVGTTSTETGNLQDGDSIWGNATGDFVSSWWTRSPYSASSGEAYYAYSQGTYSYDTIANGKWLRPAIWITSTANVDINDNNKILTT